MAINTTKIITAILIMFLIIFPKGGVMIGILPITWGYVLLGILSPFVLTSEFARGHISIKQGSLVALATVFPFFAVFVYSLYINGLGVVGFTISTAISFFFLPVMFLLLLSPAWDRLPAEYFHRWFSTAILITAIYGIFLFIWFALTGRFVGIQYLTYTGNDIDSLIRTKYISRGAVAKLISTYNNGNLYGTAILTLLPLYEYCEQSRWKRMTVRVALILTLSRTVWIGVIVDQLYHLFKSESNSTQMTSQNLVGKWIRTAFLLIACLVMIGYGMYLMGSSASFLSDSTWGGRREFSSYPNPITILPSIPITGFGEMLYTTAFWIYGYTGGASIMLIFSVPVFYALFGNELDKMQSAAYKGLFLYAIVAIGDGATMYIPVMAFYWFTYMVAICGEPGRNLGRYVSGAALEA